MYKFIKTKDKKDNDDITDVVVTIRIMDVSLEEMFEQFKGFLVACGFAIDSEDFISVIKKNEYITTNDCEDSNEMD